MSVTVSYTGRLGNNLFQYCNARLFAERIDLQLKTDWPHSDIIKFRKSKEGMESYYPKFIVTEENFEQVTNESEHPYFGKYAHYDFNGFFQQSKRYLPYRDQIKSWLVKPYKTTNFKDIVIHLRADDYGKAHRIHPQWFLDILAKETFERLHIVMHPIDHEYIEPFIKFAPKLHLMGDVKKDFETIASFNKIICSNSTFCWWAAFLGNPERVYTFAKWLPGNPQIDLTELPNGIVVDGDFWE